jgi:hypothetical protein
VREVIANALETNHPSHRALGHPLGMGAEVLGKGFSRLRYLHRIAKVREALDVLVPRLVPVDAARLQQRCDLIGC